MTTTINESTLLEALPQVVLRGSEGVYQQGDSAPFLHITNEPTMRGVVLAPSDASRGWEITAGEVGRNPEMAPYLGLRGWWVLSSDIEGGFPPVATSEAQSESELLDALPRATINSSGWVAALHHGDVMPFLHVPTMTGGYAGCILAPADAEDTGMWVVVDFHTDQHPALLPYAGMRGWWVRERELVEVPALPATVPTRDLLAEVPEDQRQHIPETARWGTVNGTYHGGLPSGDRFLAVPHPRNDDAVTVLLWPGHPTFDHGYNRESEGAPAPLLGYVIRRDSFTFDDVVPPTEEVAEEVDIADLRTVAELREQVSTLETETAALRSRLQVARSERDTISQHYASDLEKIGEIMSEEAVERDWCGEYEQVMERINGEINGEIENFQRTVEVVVDFSGSAVQSFCGSVTVEVPRSEAGDGDSVRRAFREHMANTYLSDMDLSFNEPDVSDVSDDELEVDDWNEA